MKRLFSFVSLIKWHNGRRWRSKNLVGHWLCWQTMAWGPYAGLQVFCSSKDIGAQVFYIYHDMFVPPIRCVTKTLHPIYCCLSPLAPPAAGSFLLCKGFVLQWCAVDLDDAFVLLEERLSLGATTFLDAFDVQAQGPREEGDGAWIGSVD